MLEVPDCTYRSCGYIARHPLPDANPVPLVTSQGWLQTRKAGCLEGVSICFSSFPRCWRGQPVVNSGNRWALLPRVFLTDHYNRASAGGLGKKASNHVQNASLPWVKVSRWFADPCKLHVPGSVGMQHSLLLATSSLWETRAPS